MPHQLIDMYLWFCKNVKHGVTNVMNFVIDTYDKVYKKTKRDMKSIST